MPCQWYVRGAAVKFVGPENQEADFYKIFKKVDKYFLNYHNDLSRIVS
jgi:hypothetical protein